MILYNDFVVKYPQYGIAPYSQDTVTEWLENVFILYPMIQTCLPESNWLLATRYALEHQNLMQDCDFQGNTKEYSSRNDTAQYVVSKTTFSLRSTLPGRNLYQLFSINGCYSKQGITAKEICGNSGCR
jgi:hypothetical protein